MAQVGRRVRVRKSRVAKAAEILEGEAVKTMKGGWHMKRAWCGKVKYVYPLHKTTMRVTFIVRRDELIVKVFLEVE